MTKISFFHKKICSIQKKVIPLHQIRKTNLIYILVIMINSQKYIYKI